MTDLVDTWQPERKAQEAEAVYDFIVRFTEIHHQAPRLGQCCDGTKLNDYHVKKAIERLRRQNRLSHSSLRVTQKAVQARNAKRGGDAAE